ncbi:MAG TPA: helix-turn-helix transcriptional regulator [Chthoniobacterales bacterium]|jgi:predicted transcriptional regulator|nr:helix-turn-helix transcriptional regulator [Chthoniobacterales bacterium]
MPSKESEKLIAELKAWVDAEYGRQSELARTLGRSPQLISHWLTGRRTPRLDDGLALQAFLAKQRRRR